jgi:molybdate transport system substrate-binding protein
MNCGRVLAFVMSLCCAHAAAAESIAIAAASDLKLCMDELAAQFRNARAGTDVDVSYGSSGNFATQIRQGAPFDLYFSADVAYPRALARDDLVASPVRPYAIGRIVLWSASLDASRLTLAELTRPDIARIAIANPRHAPYGKRAEEALRASGVWERVQDKLVLGENISQAAQFAQTGNAQVGIIALSLARGPSMASGHYTLVPDSLHEPLEQAFVVTRHGENNAAAQAFAAYVQTPAARAILVRHGFALPGENAVD